MDVKQVAAEREIAAQKKAQSKPEPKKEEVQEAPKETPREQPEFKGRVVNEEA